MLTPKIVLPTGTELLVSKIRQINSVLATGKNKASVASPDVYQVALAVLYRDTFIVTPRS